MSSISLPSISSSRNSVRPSVCRILSANQIEYNNLLSRRKELRTQLSHFKEENALLQTQQARMHNAITGFESEDQDTVKKHSRDLHELSEEMRTQIRKIRKTEQRLLKKELQLQKVKDELKRSKALIDVDEKKLADWDQLMDQWSQKSKLLVNKDERIQELHEQARSMTASHNSALSKEQAQSRDLELQSMKLQENIRQLQIKIKAADREIANGVIHDQSRLARSSSDTTVHSVSSHLDAAARGHRSAQQTPSLSLQQKIHMYDQQRRELWHQQLQKKEEKARELQEKAKLQQEKEEAIMRKLQKEKNRQREIEEQKAEEVKLQEEKDRKRKLKELALKEEKREKRRLLKLKLEQQKRRKEREEELQRENEEHEKIIAAIERKVAVLEEQKRRRLAAEEQEQRETEAKALQDEEERNQEYIKAQKLLSIREQSEVVEIPIVQVEHEYSNDAHEDAVEETGYYEEIPPPDLETNYDAEYQRDPSALETLELEDTGKMEVSATKVHAQDAETSAPDESLERSHHVGFPSSIRRRFEKQRRDYLFPPVVDKLHRGLPTYYNE